MRHTLAALVAASCIVVLSLAGCGGGGSTSIPPPPNGGGGTPTTAQRLAAATATANSGTNDCSRIRPFFWEIGDRDNALGSGSVNSSADPTVYTASTALSIASASKWLYSSYYAQRAGGVLSAEDIKFLTLRSGYTNFVVCPSTSTSVQACLQYGTNGAYSAATDGYFFYNGGHMQKHASLRGLGPLDNKGLADEIRSQLGAEVQLAYSQPQLAGGVYTSAEQYARVLRKILGGQLKMKSLLGTDAVCTNPKTCPSEALSTPPTPPGETWHYSIGHWVEDDPVVGDGAFSSPGLFGFYPWIDKSQTWYGVIARVDATGALDSVSCGRTIRKAWVTATPL